MSEPKTVAIESPYAGDRIRNSAYLELCIRDCLARNETPYASHKMLTTALKDSIPSDRELGIRMGLVMSARMDLRAFYVDLGWSSGMFLARDYYDKHGISYEIRNLHA